MLPASTLLHDYFDRQWQASAGRLALEIPPGVSRPHRITATYEELADRIALVAGLLRPLVSGECLVAVLLPRTCVDAHAAPIGILRAGAAFAPIDPGFPDERIRSILEDANVAAVVTDADGVERVRRVGVSPDRIIDLSNATATPGEQLPGPAWLTPESLAYVIYTSGTTGRPKGVMIEHRAIANLVSSDVRRFQLAPGDRVGQGSSHAYDSSIEETWLALASGATLVVIDDVTIRSGPDLVTWLDREGVTVFCPPPTLLRAMGLRDADRLLPRLRLLYIGGEALTRDVADAWGRGRELVNGYGPTESAVTCIRGDIHPDTAISIGRPIENVEAWILDDDLNVIPGGERGELCLGGVGLARGYWNAPELTRARFPIHPSLGRIYRTGDLACRMPSGDLLCLGRLDAQVKLRGYRIELEEIDVHLSSLPGVRAAACCVSGEGSKQQLIAFVVTDGTAGAVESYRTALRAALPAYMVPAHFQFVDELPTSVGGKLDRAALSRIVIEVQERDGAAASDAESDVERLIDAAVRQASGRGALSMDADLFDDLGADSIRVAEIITLLRAHRATSSLTVRDVYETRSIRQLARRVGPVAHERESRDEAPVPRDQEHPWQASVLQTAWLLGQIVAGTLLMSAIALVALPWALRTFGLVACALLAPAALVLAVVAYALVSIAAAVSAKRLLIGRYRPCSEPVWSWFYIRNWMVQRVVRLVPWRLLGGSILQHVVLRALGARIGQRVHIHRGVDLLQGGWDLLEIGDDATIGSDAALRLVELDEGRIAVAPVTLGAGATVSVRATVGGGARVGNGGYLTPLSVLPGGGRIPDGERWDGVPAAPAGSAPPRATPESGHRELTPSQFARRLTAMRIAMAMLVGVPAAVVAIATATVRHATAADVLHWLAAPTWDRASVMSVLAIAALPLPMTVILQAFAARWLSRPLEAGVIPRWSTAYLRVWTVTGLVHSAGEWLSGTLMWPGWLRLAGMRVGDDGEISTIIDVVPALVEIGSGCFLADGIYLAGPLVHRGAVTLARTEIGAGSFIGNHAVIPAGMTLAPGILVGVCTVADDARMRPNTSWFGHPPFELQRQRAVTDRRLTHEPSLVRRVNRWFWELLRFALPIAPVVVILFWMEWLAGLLDRTSLISFVLVAGPLVTIAAAAALCLFVLVLKWLLLGRVAPGEHALWSCWCSRWDFLFVAWRRLAAPVLSGLEGTLWLPWYLRAMGARIGRRVVLGGGFAQVVDPDMLEIEDEATVHALFQAHTFEDRILKIDRVRICRQASVAHGAVLFYGSDVGAGASVLAHSVVMKLERLPAGHAYEGCPVRRAVG